MARILAVGIATLDIISTVTEYPAEDSEVRALSRRVARGGNATNTLVVLARLGHDCDWAGVLVEAPDARPILEDLARHGIDTRHCRRLAQGRMPTSQVLLSAATHSRTIVHHRDLPEYDAEAFAGIDLSGYDWVHFEGRNPGETGRMLAHLRALRPDLKVSLEIEKPHAGIEALFPQADLLLFSRDYARRQGFDSVDAFVDDRVAACPGQALICSWGRAGAVMSDAGGRRYASPAYPPTRLVDTLGAGDTFNAGVIDARLRGLDWAQTLEAACRLAGYKCGLQGLEGIERLDAD